MAGFVQMGHISHPNKTFMTVLPDIKIVSNHYMPVALGYGGIYNSISNTTEI